MNTTKQKPSINGLTKIKKTKVYEDIAHQIKDWIERHQLKPGHRLPPERELCQIFEVSRHSVREAFRFLEKEHLIKSIPGSGTYVAAGGQEVILNVISSYLFDGSGKLAEIFELRRIIEPQVASLAAKNIDAENRAVLRRLLEKNKGFIKQRRVDHMDFVQFDHELHQAIAQATQNSVIPKVVEKLNDIITETRQENFLSQKRIKTSAQGHIEIIEAILGGLEKEAADNMEKHLIDVEKVIMGHFFRNLCVRSQNGAE